MNTMPANDTAIKHAVHLLRQGRLVAFPTETVYGLGADASNSDAIKRIFQAKGRPANHPLIVHISSTDKLDDWAVDIPDMARILATHFWPGPLAMILSKQANVPLEVTGGQQTVALRVPNHPVALSLLKAFDGGIAAPSANRFCRISPTQSAHVREELGDNVDFILEGGSCQVGVESTIIDLSGDKPKLLRLGHITQVEIETVLNTQLIVNSRQGEIRAPGMMAVHYAPTTSAQLYPSDSFPNIVEEFCRQYKKIGLLAYNQQLKANSQISIIYMPEKAETYAQNLYASLRELDNLKLDIILIEQPPQSELWRAINDRLLKATSTV
ncbi:MAG: L-threonylcarbamoyladenylate synthase [Methylococcales bacterium]|nr:L-threonylcarbamoyladenylate synthase [Methylococcales bacterium]